MTSSAYRIARLAPGQDRSRFSSGSAPLDRYFREQATQDERRRVATCFVAIDDDEEIGGFYTLSSTSILLNDLPPEVTKKMPRYPTVPAVRMGRLAVDAAAKGKGLGGALLGDALVRVARLEAAAYALVVDAKDANAARFYEHHGFRSFAGTPLSFWFPLSNLPAETLS